MPATSSNFFKVGCDRGRSFSAEVVITVYYVKRSFPSVAVKFNSICQAFMKMITEHDAVGRSGTIRQLLQHLCESVC